MLGEKTRISSSPSCSSSPPPHRVAPRSRNGGDSLGPAAAASSVPVLPCTGPALPCPAPSCGSWAQFWLQTPSPGRCQTLTVLGAFLNTECEMLRLLPACPKGVLSLRLGPEAPRGVRPRGDIRSMCSGTHAEEREGGSRKACVGAAPGRCISEQVLSRSAGSRPGSPAAGGTEGWSPPSQRPPPPTPLGQDGGTARGRKTGGPAPALPVSAVCVLSNSRPLCCLRAPQLSLAEPLESRVF